MLHRETSGFHILFIIFNELPYSLLTTDRMESPTPECLRLPALVFLKMQGHVQ